jgi:hypothetical protein
MGHGLAEYKEEERGGERGLKEGRGCGNSVVAR